MVQLRRNCLRQVQILGQGKPQDTANTLAHSLLCWDHQQLVTLCKPVVPTIRPLSQERAWGGCPARPLGSGDSQCSQHPQWAATQPCTQLPVTQVLFSLGAQLSPPGCCSSATTPKPCRPPQASEQLREVPGSARVHVCDGAHAGHRQNRLGHMQETALTLGSVPGVGCYFPMKTYFLYGFQNISQEKTT